MGIEKPGRGSSLTKGFPKPCHGHRARGQVAAALVPHCHPEIGGDTSVEQLQRCMNRARPMPFAWRPHAGALPFLLSLALDQPRQHPSTTSSPQCPLPVCGSGMAGGSCAGGSPDAAAPSQHQRWGREMTAAAPTSPRSHNTPGPPRTLHHLLHPHRLLGRSDTNAKAMGHPRSCRARSGGKLPALLCLWICTSRFPRPGADVPRRTNPGQGVGGGISTFIPLSLQRNGRMESGWTVMNCRLWKFLLP